MTENSASIYPTTPGILKYANLQMAAEAFLTFLDGDGKEVPVDGTALVAALVRGNDRSSRFTKKDSLTQFSILNSTQAKPQAAYDET